MIGEQLELGQRPISDQTEYDGVTPALAPAPELREVKAATADAIERVDEAADPAWKDLALAAIKSTCEQYQEFHVDDVWEVGRLPRTVEDRALGPVMQRARRLGYCEKTDRVRPSKRSHMSGKPVWRSLLYREAA